MVFYRLGISSKINSSVDIFVILITSFELIDMSRQVTIYET